MIQNSWKHVVSRLNARDCNLFRSIFLFEKNFWLIILLFIVAFLGKVNFLFSNQVCHLCSSLQMRNEITFTRDEVQAYYARMQQEVMQQQAQMIAQAMQNSQNNNAQISSNINF